MNLVIDDPTPAQPETLPCPDPRAHERLYAERQQTWRLTPEQRAAEWANGCGWCGGRLP